MTLPIGVNENFNDAQASSGMPRKERAEAARGILQDALQASDSLQWRLGQLLSEVRELTYYQDWGFNSFKAYLKNEFSCGLRKGQILVKLHEIFVPLAEKLGWPAGRLQRLSWSKAAFLTPIINEVNANQVLQDLEALSLRELRRKYRNPKRENEPGTLFRLKLSTSQFHELRSALQAAGKVSGHGEDAHNLTLLATAFLRQGQQRISLPALKLSSESGNWRRPRPPENEFYVGPAEWDQLCYAAHVGGNILVIGPSGCGKSEACNWVAKAFGKRLEPFNCGAMTEPRSTLIGNVHFDASRGTWFSESRFVRTVQTEGSALLLDELTRSGSDAFNLLLPLLDSQGYLALDEQEDGAVIRRAPGVTFFATCNLGAEYTGTQGLDKALKDRFQAIVVMDFPSPTREAELLTNRCSGLTPEVANRLVRLAGRQRELSKEGEFTEMISTRMLLAASRQIAVGMALKEAVTFCILNSFREDGGDASERAKLRQICQSQQVFMAQAPARPA